MALKIRHMTMADYDQAFELWRITPGVGLVKADNRENTERFLNRNPGLSFVAVNGDEVVATILCGQDGRRGHLYHLIVKEEYRRRGIAKQLVNHVTEALEKEGFDSCQLMVFPDNKDALEFWRKLGFDHFNIMIFFSPNVRKQLEEFKGYKS